MYHLHVRDAGRSPTQAKKVFAAAIESIRERTDIIVQTSTGGAMGMSADERLQPLELGPEMASLTTGTADFGDDVFFNDTALMTEFYQRMQKKGVRPEFEIFEAGQIDNALKLIKKFGPAGPLTHWDFVLGVPGSMSGEPRNLVFLVDQLPEGSTWTRTGIGRWHMPITMTSLALGGNVRLGFEDNIFYHKGVLAKENAELVGRVARIWREWGRDGHADEAGRSSSSASTPADADDPGRAAASSRRWHRHSFPSSNRRTLSTWTPTGKAGREWSGRVAGPSAGVH